MGTKALMNTQNKILSGKIMEKGIGGGKIIRDYNYK